MNRRDAIWERAFAPPDTREIWEWAHAEGEIPASAYAVSGRFDADLVPWVKEPFRALRSSHVRTVTAMWGVQLLKTLLGEIWLLWLIANDPGPTQWVQPDDQEAKEHAEERFLALLAGFPCVARYFLPDRHKKKTTAIFFSHMWMRMEGAHNPGNAQRKSVKNQLCSEVWQAEKWRPGALAEFNSRMTQFTYNSKRLIESQPGMAAWMNVDDMEKTYLDGTQERWHVACLSCGKFQPMKWSGTIADGSRCGMVWDTSEKTRRVTDSSDPNEIWRWQELKASIAWVCEFCGHRHHDDPTTRRRLCDTGKYIAQNPHADGTHRSFGGVNQLTAPNLSWFETPVGGVKNFLMARAMARQGDDRRQREFFQKVLAEPYDPDKFSTVEKIPAITLTTQENPDGTRKFWELQDFIFMLIDKQLGHYWCLVEAWSKTGQRCVIFADKVQTLEELRSKQVEYGVRDECVFMDAGKWRTQVFGECAQHGHYGKFQGRDYWFCWQSLVASAAAKFPSIIRQRTFDNGVEHFKWTKVELPYTADLNYGDPLLGTHTDDARRVSLAGKKCLVTTWSHPTVGDITHHYRVQMERHSNAFVGPLVSHHFAKHIYSWEKRLVDRRGGGKEWKWVQVRSQDHLWACWNMSTVAACMSKIVANFTPVAEPQEPMKPAV